MPGNSFIKFAGISDGESMQKGYENWIEIQEWSWEVESDSSWLKGQGSSVGTAKPGAVTFTHYYDVSSPVILKKIASGTTFDEVTIVQTKQVGGAEPVKFFEIKLKNVFITKVSNKSSEDGNINQDVDLTFKEIYINYNKQKNEGEIDKTPREFEWNVSTQVVKT